MERTVGVVKDDFWMVLRPLACSSGQPFSENQLINDLPVVINNCGAISIILKMADQELSRTKRYP